jgi:hypothetical protein
MINNFFFAVCTYIGLVIVFLSPRSNETTAQGKQKEPPEVQILDAKPKNEEVKRRLNYPKMNLSY